MKQLQTQFPEMAVGAHSDSESEENAEKSSSDEPENCKDQGGEEGVTEYEKQRLSRIRENKARLEALGLPGIASSLLGSVEKKKKQAKRKGKSKKNEDDEYRPTVVEARVSSSSEEEEEEEEDLQVRVHGSSGSSRRGSVCKGKNTRSLNSKKNNKKKGLVRKNLSESDFIDDDEALQQAIALSLGNSSEVSGEVCQPPPQCSRTEVTDTDRSERKGMSHVKENHGWRKRKKSIRQNTNRVQMTEDQVIIHFFQFDEAGKGKISKRDLQRVATAHDFGWTDKEIADMIHCFDSDGDGKLSLDDFRKIMYRCNMVQGHESSSIV